MQIAGKLSYRSDVLKVWAENPRATLADVYKQTGAPKMVVLKLRRELVEAGVLKAGGHKW